MKKRASRSVKDSDQPAVAALTLEYPRPFRSAILTLTVSVAAFIALACGDESPPSSPVPDATQARPLATATPKFTPTPSPVPTVTQNPTLTPVPSPTAAHNPEPSTLTIKQLLDATTAAMASVESGHSTVEVIWTIWTGDDTQKATMSLEGDFQMPDRGQGLMAVSQENFNQEAEFVIIGSKTYNRLPGSDAWGMGYDDSLFRLLTSGAFDTDFNPEMVKKIRTSCSTS